MFFDVDQLLRLRRVVRSLDPDGPPRLQFLEGSVDAAPARLALMPGSFNPPTYAHLALADAVVRTGRVDRVDFLIATRTVNKETIEGASLPDRLVMLLALVRSRPDLGVVLVNRGLYVDQAELVRATVPGVRDLWFVVGFDKIVQIFDPRYYRNRDEALDRLFSLARFFVAPRDDAGRVSLADLLARPENRRYAEAVEFLDLAASFGHVSSSRFRAHDPLAGPTVPPVVLDFMREAGGYATCEPADREARRRYRVREDLLDELERGESTLASPAGFRDAIMLRLAAHRDEPA
jgi:nicotinic acid mononucleotide adenylyltransferase